MPDRAIILTGSAQIEAHRRRGFLTEVAPLLEATRAEEGCLLYCLSGDPTDEGRVLIHEMWASAQALDAHMQVENFARTAELLLSLSPTHLEVTKHRVDASEPLFDATGKPTTVFRT